MSIFDSVVSIPCHPKNRGGKRTAKQIKYLVFHYTGNDGDHDTANAQYYQDNPLKKPSSAHYFVDDDSITQSVEDLGVAYAVGGARWSDCLKTGGGSLYGICTNTNSLSIELCDTKRDGVLMATEKTLDKAVELGKALMKKYGIPIERVIRHFDVTGKHCPAYFMDSEAWTKFKNRLVEEENEMKLYNYVNQLPYGQEAVTRAIQNGYIKLNPDGSMGLWECNIQTCILLDRAGVFDKPAIEGR